MKANPGLQRDRGLFSNLFFSIQALTRCQYFGLARQVLDSKVLMIGFEDGFEFLQ